MDPKELSLEDAVLDGIHEGFDVVERPLSQRAFSIFGIVAVCIGIFFFGRTAYIGFFKKGQYESRAYANAGQEIILRAPRGIIFDRYGVPLVKNEASFDVSLNLSELFKEKDRIPEVLSAIKNILPINQDETYDAILKTDLERQSYFTLARNVPLTQVIELKKAAIPSVIIEDGYARVYPDAGAFSHILGYTGLVSQSDMERESGLDLNDEIGKAGIERVYDAYIRGRNGSRILFRDANNNQLGEKVEHPAQSGANVYTTIDAELQKVFYTSLKNRLESLGRKAGAGIAINPQTGEVLSLISFPSFDPNDLTKELFSDPSQPTFNRAISGVYSPGSTIKPLVAFGALEENVIDPLTSIFSAGYIELPNPYTPSQPSRFVDWKPHGWVNMYSALARSSNVYFYEVGGGFQQQQGLGIDRLREYWQKFLLDKKTGIDLPGEEEGYLPSPDAKEKRTGTIWRIGDTYNVSIGQGDLLISPMELIRYIGGIAAKGKLFQPYIVSKIEGDKDRVVYEKKQEYDPVEQTKPDSFDEVEAGMLQTTQKDYGTAYTLNGIPMDIAAKTGSAQVQNNKKENAFFVGYAPVPNPQIAILILIEDAREGSLNAVPVAKDVFDWYYKNRIQKTPDQASAAKE